MAAINFAPSPQFVPLIWSDLKINLIFIDGLFNVNEATRQESAGCRGMRVGGGGDNEFRKHHRGLVELQEDDREKFVDGES